MRTTSHRMCREYGSLRVDGAIRLCALTQLRSNKKLVDIFGERFVAAYAAVKESEYETFLRVISSWEREHLLLQV